MNVLMIPQNHEYIRRLKSSLEGMGVNVKVLRPFHYATLTNLIQMLLFRVKGYKIVHVHWLYIFPAGIVMKWFYYFCKMLNIKIIWEMHNIVPHHYKEKDRGMSKWFYEKCDGVIFHSESDIHRSREILGTDVEKRKVVVPHGNFNGSYLNTVSGEEARKALGISEDKKVILCFGFIRENRGYEYLIEATKDMVRLGRNHRGQSGR